MKSFKDLGITVETRGFVGEKIDVKKILNVEIELHAYDIKPSKHYAGRECIWLQIRHRDEFRVVFLEGKKLREVLDKTTRESFPFRTTIRQENDWYEFT